MPSRSHFAAALLAATTLPCVAGPSLDAQGIDRATWSSPAPSPGSRPAANIVKAAVLLDRAQFSPGVIDGFAGDNFHAALTAFQRQAGLEVSGRLDQATWDRLTAGAPKPIAAYTISPEDAKGPFTRHIPPGFEAQARLKRLGYTSIVEELGERFHMSPALLRELNPKARFRSGDEIAVADVTVPVPTEKAARVVVDKAGHDVEVLAADGRLMAFYPASIGSTEKPAPSGDFTIRRVDRDPIYTYNPKYRFDGVTAKQPFSIQPGPNNPVGLVWMDLGGDGYGIHGTPHPEQVGKTQSHGCIRLTNWNALNLAERVQAGTPVSFGDVPGSQAPVAPPPTAEADRERPASASTPATAPRPGR